MKDGGTEGIASTFPSNVICKLYQIGNISQSMGTFCGGAEEGGRTLVKTERHMNCFSSHLEQAALFLGLSLS